MISKDIILVTNNNYDCDNVYGTWKWERSEIITVRCIILVSIIVINVMQVNYALLHIILECFPCQYISKQMKQRNTIVAIKQPSRSCIMI